MTGIVVPHHRACLPLARIGDLNGQTWLEPYLAGATLRRILQPGDKSDGKLWYAWCGEAPASTVNQHQRGIEDDSLPSSKAKSSEQCLRRLFPVMDVKRLATDAPILDGDGRLYSVWLKSLSDRSTECPVLHWGYGFACPSSISDIDGPWSRRLSAAPILSR